MPTRALTGRLPAPRIDLGMPVIRAMREGVAVDREQLAAHSDASSS